MNPLNLLKFAIDNLRGTPFEFWVNALLFGLFAAVVAKIIILLVGKQQLAWAANMLVTSSAKLKAELTYVGRAKEIQERIGPYFELMANLYMAFLGLYWAIVISLILYLGHGKGPWYAEIIGMLMCLGSFLYIRWNIAGASRVYEKIRQRKN